MLRCPLESHQYPLAFNLATQGILGTLQRLQKGQQVGRRKSIVVPIREQRLEQTVEGPDFLHFLFFNRILNFLKENPKGQS